MRSAFVAVLLAITLFGSVGQERSSSKPDGRMWQIFGNLGLTRQYQRCLSAGRYRRISIGRNRRIHC